MGSSETLVDGRSQRRHAEHASPATCAIGACVHASQHDEFTRKLSVAGGKGPDGRTLREWYAAEADYISAAGTIVGDDVFDFWRHRFAAWVGTVSTKPHTGKETLGAKAIRASNEFTAGLRERTERPSRELGPARPLRAIAGGE